MTLAISPQHTFETGDGRIQHLAPLFTVEFTVERSDHRNTRTAAIPLTAELRRQTKQWHGDL